MKYLPSIVLYGVIAHALYILPLGIGVVVAVSKFGDEADRRERVYQQYRTNERTAEDLSVKVKPHLDAISFERDVAVADQYAKIGDILGRVEGDAGASLKREKFRKEPAKRQFAPDLLTVGEEYGITFSGRYGALQSAALKLELHRPNMFLLSMTLTAPGDRSAAMLVSESTYLSFIDTPQP